MRSHILNEVACGIFAKERIIASVGEFYTINSFSEKIFLSTET